jgi:hypothetical protein
MQKHTKTIWVGAKPDDVLIETVPGREAWKIVPAEVNRERALQLLMALQDALDERDAYLNPKGEPNEDQD